MAEVHKIIHKIGKYLNGNVIDIGCGDQAVIESAFGVDGRDFPCVNFRTNSLYDLPSKMSDKIGYFDVVVSSHTLEHLPDSYRAIYEWQMLLKSGGYFILYLPDGRHYDNYENKEHFHDTTYPQFLFWIKRAFCGEAYTFDGSLYSQPIFNLVESGEDIGYDRYSFYIILQKI